MAKITLILEDTDEGVSLSFEFDPPIKDLPEDADGKVEMTPAMVVADEAYSVIMKVDPLACSCGGKCPCK